MKVDGLKAEIDLSVDKLYVAKNGQLIAIEPPSSGFGEQTAIWKDGKIIHVVDTKRIKL